MAFRVEKRTLGCLSALLLAPALAAESSFQYHVLHAHSRPPHIKKAGCEGTLTFNASGVSFEEARPNAKPRKHPHAWHWDYQDVQQLQISPKSVEVSSYKDRTWKLGDQEYDFDLDSKESFQNAYQFLKTRLDQRLVAVFADAPGGMLWELPVKHLAALGGDEGVLEIGSSVITYKSSKEQESRTWRFADIDNISSSGPFQLTITTFERARLQYGDRKEFNFVLKQPLEEQRYNDLWLRLNESKGLQILRSYAESNP